MALFAFCFALAGKLLYHKQLIYNVVCSQGEYTQSMFAFGFLNLTSRVCFSTLWDIFGTHTVLPVAQSTVCAQ